MSISNYTNVFGETATDHDLEHIFDVLNENNDDRIQFREFMKHTANCGFKPGQDKSRQVFDHIASLSDDKIINKKAWIQGIKIAYQNPLTQQCYRAIVSGGQYDPQSGRSEIDLDDITKSLKDTKADWQHRIECMQSLARQITTSKLSTDKFHTIFRQTHVGLTKQARDRRSNVMRVACEAEAKIIRRWKKEFSRYGCTLIEYLYELVRVKIDVVNKFGKAVILCLVKHCPDKSKLRFLELLGKEANHSKYQHLKKDCFEILLVYFHHQTNSLKDDDEFWKLLMKVTKKGVEDVDQIRNAALHLLAAIQVERHDLAFPIIKTMNEHLRKRFEAEYQISRGSGRSGGGGFGSSSSKKTKKKSFKDEFKSNGAFLSVGGNDHVRKHTWSTNDLVRGFAAMQLKQAESKKKKKHKDKDKTKVKAKFPEPPPGQFFNCFGESVTPIDILYAFQFVDIRNDRKITLDEMSIACEKMDIDKAQKLFGYLDVNNNDSVDYNDWKQALAEKKSKLKNFWYRVLGGRHLEETPKDIDFDIEEANKILGNSANDQNARILALHSITRRMCTKLSEEKFHKLFKKCVGNIILQLYDRKTYVIRETCICFGKIMIARRAQFIKFAIRVLEALFDIIKINDEKTHMSAHQAAKVLIRFIPDSKKFPIFAIVCRGCCEKSFVLTRNSSFEYVNHILARMVQVDQSRNDRFWAYMEKILNSGLCDADQGVRDAAYSALAKTELVRRDLANDYVKTLRKAQKEKYINIKKYVMAHIQEEDFGSEGPGLLIALGGMSMGSSSGGDWGQMMESPTGQRDSFKKHKQKKSVQKLNKINKSAKNLGGGGGPSPKITNDSRFTLTPQGFAELGHDYNESKKQEKKAVSRKKSPNPHKRAVSKGRSATVSVPNSNKHIKKKKSTGSLTTDDYVPTRKRDRANMGKRQTRPATARISSGQKGKNKKNNDSLKKNKKNNMTQTKKKKNKGKVEKEKEKVKVKVKVKEKEKPKPKMTMQQQARQALCVTAHKQLVQVFIEKTEDLTGSISFNQFRQCLEALDLDVGKGDALKAFSELDEDKQQVLDMEEFGHAVHVAYPEYDLLWKQLGRSKYKYYATLESLMSMEEIKSVIADKKSVWKEKTRCMRCACTMICDSKRKDNDVTAMIKKLIDALTVALRSNNQLVVREACVTVATMAKERTVCLKGVVGKLLKTCWELLDVKIPLIKFSAAECLKIVIKYVPDDSDNKYLKTLIQGTMLHDFSSVRQSCYECIIMMILRAGNPNNTMGNDFWKRIRQIIIDGVQSDEQEVKDYVFHCLYAFEKASYLKAQRLLESLDAHVIKEYKKAVSHTDEDEVASNASSPSPLPTIEPQEEKEPSTKVVVSVKAKTPEPINTNINTIDEDEKESPQKDMDSKPETPSKYKITPKSGGSGGLSTPIPSNTSLPIGYEERTIQIEDVYNKLDEKKTGFVNRFKAMKFLKELMNVNMRNAEIILSGLDDKSGKFTKDMLTNWAYAHSPEMEPNPVLHTEADSIGWLMLRRPRLEKRIQLYSSLLQLEKGDKNYGMVYDLDHKICILNYLLKQC